MRHQHKNIRYKGWNGPPSLRSNGRSSSYYNNERQWVWASAGAISLCRCGLTPQNVVKNGHCARLYSREWIEAGTAVVSFFCFTGLLYLITDHHGHLATHARTQTHVCFFHILYFYFLSFFVLIFLLRMGASPVLSLTVCFMFPTLVCLYKKNRRRCKRPVMSSSLTLILNFHSTTTHWSK